MSRYADQIQDEFQRPVAGATVYVYVWDEDEETAGDLDTLTNDAAAQLANPLTTDAFGQFYFNAVDGAKLLEVHYNGRVRFKEVIRVGPLPAGPVGPAGDVAKVGLRAELAAIAGQAAKSTRFLAEAGREGLFVFDTSNLAAAVAGDPGQGIYIAPATDATGASGAWVRKFSGVVDVGWFGAAANGVTNDAVALQRALDFATSNGLTCYFPGGDYAIGSSLTISTAGFSVLGDGWYKTRLIPTAAVPAVIISGAFGRMQGIGIWGTASGAGVGPGTYGLVLKNAGGSDFVGVHARNLATAGVYIDPAYGGGAAGNNNLLRFLGGGCNSNGGIGYKMAQHGDNNGISYLGVEANGNTSHGMLLKSEGWYVSPSCITEGNGGYGVQIGEDADGASNTNGFYDQPWTEANALGDVRSSATAGSNRIRLKSIGNTYSRNAAAVDTVEYIAAGLNRFGSNDGNTFLQASANGASAYFLAASRTGAAVNLNLGAAGAGVIHALNDVHLDSSKLYDGATGLQLVGARKTGWAADTGATKRTATAAYVVGAALAVGAAYSQAEVTAIKDRQALIEAALRDATQTIKALKDDLIAHGLIGA